MKFPDKIPDFVISYAYEMMAGLGSVARTISVSVGKENEIAITGGSPELERPFHTYDNRYVSLQEFINGVSKRIGN